MSDLVDRIKEKFGESFKEAQKQSETRRAKFKALKEQALEVLELAKKIKDVSPDGRPTDLEDSENPQMRQLYQMYTQSIDSANSIISEATQYASLESPEGKQDVPNTVSFRAKNGDEIELPIDLIEQIMTDPDFASQELRKMIDAGNDDVVDIISGLIGDQIVNEERNRFETVNQASLTEGKPIGVSSEKVGSNASPVDNAIDIIKGMLRNRQRGSESALVGEASRLFKKGQMGRRMIFQE